MLDLRWIFILLLCFCLNCKAFADNKKPAEENDPCGGDFAIISIVNRPTVANSACVVKYGKAMVEMGLQHLKLLKSGYGYNLPELEIRIGLPKETELAITPPNYIDQSATGFGPTIVGIKHRFKYTKDWVLTGEVLVTPPSGSDQNGSAGTGAAINGIFSYNITETLSIDTMLGITTQTLPRSLGGGRYNSFNPDFVFSWQPIKRLLFYYEIYGQTKTSPSSGVSFNEDLGVLYGINQNWEVDFSVGNRLNGNLLGFNYYWGIGTAISI